MTGDVRNVRVVHPLDGIEAEVHPADLLRVGHQMWNEWRQHPEYGDHDLILGLDAGGILPTVALALATATPYKLAWKLDLGLPDKHLFHERHARRTEVFVYGSLRRRRILIVDDEVTTGWTVAGLVEVLRRCGAVVIGVLCLVEDTSGDGRRMLDELGIPCCCMTSI